MCPLVCRIFYWMNFLWGFMDVGYPGGEGLVLDRPQPSLLSPFWKLDGFSKFQKIDHFHPFYKNALHSSPTHAFLICINFFSLLILRILLFMIIAMKLSKDSIVNNNVCEIPLQFHLNDCHYYLVNIQSSV